MRIAPGGLFDEAVHEFQVFENVQGPFTSRYAQCHPNLVTKLRNNLGIEAKVEQCLRGCIRQRVQLI